jgi:serine protease Do
MKNRMRTFGIATCALGLLAGGAEAQQLRDVFRRVNSSVVVVQAVAKSPETSKPGETVSGGLGSGFLVSRDGKVLTAAHVVQAASNIAVRFLDGAPIPARVIASAPFADVALLQLEQVPPSATVAAMADSNTVETGDQIFTIGAPFGANHSLSVGASPKTPSRM